MNIKHSDNNYLIDRYFSKDQNIGFNFTNTAITTSLLTGYYEIENYTYFYYRLSSYLKYRWVSVKFLYNIYDSDKLFLKNYMGLSVKISPEIKNKRYRPYGKVKFNNLSVNNLYRVNQGHLSFYNEYTPETYGSGGINITDIELGVIFNYFKIALIYENYYNMPFLHGYDFDASEDEGEYFFIQNSSDYLIEITWIFKD